MTTLHDGRGPGSFERRTLRRIYEPKSPTVLAENVVICVMLGLVAGFIFGVLVLW